MVVRDPWTVIRDGDDDTVRFAGDGGHDIGIGGRMADGVLEQIPKTRPHQRWVAPCPCRLAPDGDERLGEDRLGRDFLYEDSGIDVFDSDQQFIMFETFQRQKISKDGSHLVARPVYMLEHRAVARLVERPLLYRYGEPDETLDHGERLDQLMIDRSKKVPSHIRPRPQSSRGP